MSKRKRKVWMLIAAAVVGTAFQVLPAGCRDFGVNAALTGFDFCSVLNCTGGTFFNFCSPVKLLVDCP